MKKHEANQYINMMKRIEQCTNNFMDDIEDDSIKKIALTVYEIARDEMNRYHDVYVKPFLNEFKES